MARITKLISKYPWLAYLFICLVAVADAIVSIVLLYPNDFAPVGIQGFVTMIQHMLGISVGYLYLFVNAPLLILAFFILTKGYSFKNLSYILTFSVSTVVAQKIIAHFDLSFLEFHAKTDEQAIIAAALYGLSFSTAEVEKTATLSIPTTRAMTRNRDMTFFVFFMQFPP